jgi:hypothetical protein
MFLEAQPTRSASGAPGGDVKTHFDPRLSRVVYVLTGLQTPVRCWSKRNWQQQSPKWREHGLGQLGFWQAYVSTPPQTVNLGPNVCSELGRLSRLRGSVRSARWPDALAWSVETLAHESVHVRGIADEWKAECYGMQTMTTAASALGRTRAEGRYLASYYWRVWYPQNESPYRSPECRNGGPLDLHPNGDTWP